MSRNSPIDWVKSSLVRYDQIEDLTQVLPALYLGGLQSIKDHNRLKELKISHIVSVHKNAEPIDDPFFDCKCISISDSSCEELYKYFKEVIIFIHQARIKDKGVLIHCLAGVSRSASLIIAYLMTIFRENLDNCLNFVMKRRSCINPNFGFLNQLSEFELLDSENVNKLIKKIFNSENKLLENDISIFNDFKNDNNSKDDKKRKGSLSSSNSSTLLDSMTSLSCNKLCNDSNYRKSPSNLHLGSQSFRMPSKPSFKSSVLVSSTTTKPFVLSVAPGRKKVLSARVSSVNLRKSDLLNVSPRIESKTETNIPSLVEGSLKKHDVIKKQLENMNLVTDLKKINKIDESVNIDDTDNNDVLSEQAGELEIDEASCSTTNMSKDDRFCVVKVKNDYYQDKKICDGSLKDTNNSNVCKNELSSKIINCTEFSHVELGNTLHDIYNDSSNTNILCNKTQSDSKRLLKIHLKKLVTNLPNTSINVNENSNRKYSQDDNDIDLTYSINSNSVIENNELNLQSSILGFLYDSSQENNYTTTSNSNTKLVDESSSIFSIIGVENSNSINDNNVCEKSKYSATTASYCSTIGNSDDASNIFNEKSIMKRSLSNNSPKMEYPFDYLSDARAAEFERRFSKSNYSLSSCNSVDISCSDDNMFTSND